MLKLTELSAGIWLAGLLLLAITLYLLAKQSNSNLVAALLALPCALALWYVADLVGILPTFQPVPAVAVTTIEQPVTMVVTATAGNTATNWANVPPDVARWQAVINDAAAHCGLDPLLIAAVMWQESKGDPNVVGGAGEIGLMQIMPFANRPLAQIRADAAFNVKWGACYLGSRIAAHGGDYQRGIKAYNGTGAAADRYAHLIIGHWARFAGQVVQQPQQPVSNPSAQYKFPSSPFASYAMTSHFRSTARPNHKGVDLGARGDTTIRAVESGIVEHVGFFYCATDCLGPFGIVINHGTWRTVYGHSDLVYVTPGAAVTAGQPIARQGALGRADGPHLHLEMRIGGKLVVDNAGVANVVGSQIVNPVQFLP